MIKENDIPKWSHNEYIIKSTTIHPDDIYPDNVTIFTISYKDYNDVPTHVQISWNNGRNITANKIISSLIERCISKIVEEECIYNPSFYDAPIYMKDKMIEEARAGFINDNEKALRSFYKMIVKYQEKL